MRGAVATVLRLGAEHCAGTPILCVKIDWLVLFFVWLRSPGCAVGGWMTAALMVGLARGRLAWFLAEKPGLVCLSGGLTFVGGRLHDLDCR